MARRGDKLVWTEPRAYHRPQWFAAIRESRILTVGFWVRCTLVCAAVGAGGIALIWHLYPGAQIPIGALASVLVVMPVFVIGSTMLDLLIPRSVTVTPKHVLVSHGDSAFTIPWERVRRVRLEPSDGWGVMLVIDYEAHRGDVRTFSTPVPNKIELARLIACIPVKVEVDLPMPAGSSPHAPPA